MLSLDELTSYQLQLGRPNERIAAAVSLLQQRVKVHVRNGGSKNYGGTGDFCPPPTSGSPHFVRVTGSIYDILATHPVGGQLLSGWHVHGRVVLHGRRIHFKVHFEAFCVGIFLHCRHDCRLV